MDWKKLGKTALFPCFAIRLLLIPVSAAFLLYSMLCIGTKSPAAIISYVLSAYTLTVWCIKLPVLFRFFITFRDHNRYICRWREDTRLRVNVSLYASLVWNTAYAVFQLCLGLWHQTFWFCSLAGYYASLAAMRFFLVRHTSRNQPGEKMLAELRIYRACGIIFLITNLAITLMIFFMVYWNRTFIHHEITTIAMAAYTFTSLTLSIINIFRYRRLGSPVFSASKAISLASACVSLLTLEATMLTTFGTESLTLFARRIFLGTSGGAVSAFIIAMAVYMIFHGSKAIRKLRQHPQKHA